MKIISLILRSSFLMLLLVGCATNKMNESIHIPAGKGDLEKVKTEIDGGKNVNSKDIAGQTALMYASELGRLEVVKYLVEKGADINAKSGRHGRGTALIYASGLNRITVMDYLLEHGADIDSVTHFNETALFWATAKGHIDAVNLLLRMKANTKIKNKKGKTVLDVAKELNRKEIELALELASEAIKKSDIQKEFKIAQQQGKQRLLAFIGEYPDSEFVDESKRSITRIDEIVESMKSREIIKFFKIGMTVTQLKKTNGDPQFSSIKITNIDSNGRVGMTHAGGLEVGWLYCDGYPKDLPYCGIVSVITNLKEVVTKVSSGAVYYSQ